MNDATPEEIRADTLYRDRVTLGLIAYRFRAKGNERYIFPDIPQTGSWYAKLSQAREGMLHDVESQRPVYFTPYTLGGVDQEAYSSRPSRRPIGSPGTSLARSAGISRAL